MSKSHVGESIRAESLIVDQGLPLESNATVSPSSLSPSLRSKEVPIGLPNQETQHNVVYIDLTGVNIRGNRVQFSCLCLDRTDSYSFPSVFYSLDGVEQPVSLRFDMGKRIFIDNLGDEELDRFLKEVSPKISDVIADYLRSRVNAV
jgi:hypothetical protein